jgi:hypothetical protein
MADVHIPGIGNIPKGWAYAGLGVGGIAAFVIYRKSSGSTAADTSTAAGTSTADDTTGDGDLDPLTGYPEGSEEDEDALASEGYTGQDTGVGDEVTPTTTTTATSPTTPQAWAEQVESVLPGFGFNEYNVASACGRYIGGLSLDANQANIIQTALGEVPYPGTAPPVKTSQPKPTTKNSAHRDTASGKQSLDTVAKSRGTTSAHIIDVTDTGSNIDAAHKKKFDAYVQGGTNKNMPRGLVYYTSN